MGYFLIVFGLIVIVWGIIIVRRPKTAEKIEVVQPEIKRVDIL